MEKNHDAKKAALAKRISQFGLWAIRLTWAAIGVEILRIIYQIIMYRYSQSVQLELESDFLNYLEVSEITKYQDFWKYWLPNGLLLIGVLAVSIILYRHIRKEGTPFTAKSVKLLRIAAVLTGLRALFNPVENAVISILQAFSFNSSSFLRQLFLNITTWVCMLLFFCCEVVRFGADLQRKSDETL